jgi:peptidyl-prolyl cis-trans isomerase B (cyclophilin B)
VPAIALTLFVVAVALVVAIGVTGSSSEVAGAGSPLPGAGSPSPGAASATETSGSTGTAAANAASPVASSTGPTTGPCGYTPTGTAARDVGQPPDPTPTPTADRTVAITSNLGALTLTLHGAAAPCNVQCGDPSGTGAGGPGYSSQDENLAAADYSQVGTIAMANAGPDTNGSQFFIIYKDSSADLAKSYTVIGTVSAGMGIVQRVAAAGSDQSNGPDDGRPLLPITFTKLTVS